jgi:antitoxin (DNA-binding transcriptional repressor) of toxin-antitoxin stability system
MYKFDKIIVQMTTTVQISDFRNNISNYIDRMIIDQGIINIKRGNTVVAKVFPQIKSKKWKPDWVGFWSDLEKIWATQPKSNKKTNYSMRIDEILYGKK